MSNKTNAEIESELIKCLKSWEPNACLLGNVTAGEIIKLLDEKDAEITKSEMDLNTYKVYEKEREEQLKQAQDEIEALEIDKHKTSSMVEGLVLSILDTVERNQDIELKLQKSRELIGELVETLSHAKLFTITREKMHPTGRLLYKDLLAKAEKFLKDGE